VNVTTSIDVVDGPDPSAPCDPLCVVVPSSEGGIAVYVSTECGPYPPAADTSGASPGCARALAAYNRNNTCADDGGASNPLEAGAD
jgi:hypothetical protein